MSPKAPQVMGARCYLYIWMYVCVHIVCWCVRCTYILNVSSDLHSSPEGHAIAPRLLWVKPSLNRLQRLVHQKGSI